MSCDYHGRVDFRAFDVMVDAIGKADREAIANALATAKEMASDARKPASDRLIWGDFCALLRAHMKRF